MARFLGDAASLLMKVLMRKSFSMFDEFSCLFADLASLVLSALRFSSVMARQPSPFPRPPPSAPSTSASTSSSSAAAAASASASASAMRYSPILMSMAIRHRAY